MVYYSQAVSYYQSTMPVMNRAVRSSTLERSYRSNAGSTYDLSNRYARAATVGPSSIYSNPDYYGIMPFNRSLHTIEDRMRTRAASLEPVSTYRRAYHSGTSYGATTSFDYKVMDYASRLDAEETNREYLNQMRSNYAARSSAISSPRYAGMGSRTTGSELDSFRLNSRDLYAYKHYRKSNQTLTDRNTRASSPLQTRELDRYYKTERRSSYMGDLSSGGHRDFRYYNFRSVPYYGGSDYYTYVPRLISWVNNDVRSSPRFV